MPAASISLLALESDEARGSDLSIGTDSGCHISFDRSPWSPAHHGICRGQNPMVYLFR